MGEALTLDGVLQGRNHMILAQDIGKCPRAVFSGKDLITHARQSRERGDFGNPDLSVFLIPLRLEGLRLNYEAALVIAPTYRVLRVYDHE